MAMLLLDALQPGGIVALQADGSALVAALGALARIKPEAVVQVLDEGGLEDLSTCISLSGVPRRGHRAALVTITTVKGETETFTVRGGELWVYPLSIGVRARVRIAVFGRGVSIGGKRRMRMDLDGGSAGLIIDARGRPLPLPTSVKALAPMIAEWYAQATGDPAFPIPADWLVPTIEEPNIESVTDSRSGRRGRAVKALGAEANSSKPRRGLFGRRGRETAKAAEPEGDESDLRSLLS
jgi:hypothetical protein